MPRVPEQLGSPGVVVWRARHLVGMVRGAGLVFVGLKLIESEADPNAVDWPPHVGCFGAVRPRSGVNRIEEADVNASMETFSPTSGTPR